MINGNIIEQVTDFKYLENPIAEYKSDLEDKLQTYNKFNANVWELHTEGLNCDK